ncbi:DUF4192 domain-containing protein [Mycolicibacterium goodii]|uniref:DUF4192 domain-containing protein n=1 Tax=Mycolicibacterium goodii TaxID=134601 RepID=UPI001BDCEC0F|nr:DUF4192 domain-containing protein [Mycolicibacterium goodii]MBU8820958.1 DUF4192 domain-containing protein [Mycolicibacterium goodii]
MGKIGVLGNVVRNIVGVLGFAPVESLVLVLVRGGVVDTVMRVDLRGATGAGGAARLAELVARQDADGVVAVVVSEEGATCPTCGEQFRAVIDDVALALQRRGYPLLAAVMVDRIAAGGRWWCLDDKAVAGVLEDPASSALAATAVANGRRMFASRAELAQFVAVDAERVAAVAPLVGVGGPVKDVAVAVRAAVDAARRMAGGEVVSDAVLAEVGTSLADVRVRDALLHVGDADETAAAEALWRVLARVLPAPFRAEALAVLAFSCFLRGDGVLAGVALNAALADNPGHGLAGLLDTALENGMQPKELHGLIARIPPAVTV